MNHQYGEDQDRVSVAGFDVPDSPDSSYTSASYPGNEDEGRDPPALPPHLQHTLLNRQVDPDWGAAAPQNVTVNHLYIENREAPRSVVGLGVTHRFRSKYVTVVLYKPVRNT
ncbi:5'-AMP-activated protein kinase beta-2 subunit protein [Striga asiatica]|uniref:5'-AMP-activated protein kinase beta-2 subunit protein n=1 Tax=Striga asiatica TaxID=4170 RepID=A0A5A7P7F3_STRAF|nr:5'-AMP-activated protein kinase beta-2 subunit protein [Striga asiatica]